MSTTSSIFSICIQQHISSNFSKISGNKNAFNNSMSVWYLRMFSCATGWLDHSIPPLPRSGLGLQIPHEPGSFAPPAPLPLAGGPQGLRQALCLLGLWTSAGSLGTCVLTWCRVKMLSPRTCPENLARLDSHTYFPFSTPAVIKTRCSTILVFTFNINAHKTNTGFNIFIPVWACFLSHDSLHPGKWKAERRKGNPAMFLLKGIQEPRLTLRPFGSGPWHPGKVPHLSSWPARGFPGGDTQCLPTCRLSLCMCPPLLSFRQPVTYRRQNCTFRVNGTRS